MTPDTAGRRLLARQVAFLVTVTTMAVGSTWWTVAQGHSPRAELPLVAGMTAAFFAARLLTIRLPRGDEVNTTLVAGLVGIALVNLPALVASAALAGLADAALRYSPETRSQSLYRLLDALRSTAVLGILSPWQLLLHPVTVSSGGDQVIVWALVAGASYAALDLLTTAIQQAASGGLRLFQGLASLLRPLGTVHVVHLPLAAVVLRLHSVSAVWPFAVGVLLTLILQNSFNLYLRIRRAYTETILALAHAAELDRPAETGHARRVADLSISVARQMGLKGRELEKVGYAALLHDIGRMGSRGDDSSEDCAVRGAEIVSSVPFLADVAPIIGPTVAGGDSRTLVAQSIVRACDEYDSLKSVVGMQHALSALSQPDGKHSASVLAVIDVLARSECRSTGVSS